MKTGLKIREIVLFALLGTVMFCSKWVTELIPNVHLLAMFTIAYTVVFRAKALFPIFVFITLMAIFSGGIWWIPYVYLWPILWGVTMLLPKKMPKKVAFFVYMAVAALHGLLYGTLYAPFQALIYGYDLQKMLLWISIGFPWDVLHAVGNICASMLTIPVIELLTRSGALRE